MSNTLSLHDALPICPWHDPDSMEEYEPYFRNGFRLATEHDLELVPDPNIDPEAFEQWVESKISCKKPILVHQHPADEEDEAELKNAVLVFDDEVEDSHIPEDGGFYTIAYGAKTGDRQLDEALGHLTTNITKQVGGLLANQLQQMQVHMGNQKLPNWAEEWPSSEISGASKPSVGKAGDFDDFLRGLGHLHGQELFTIDETAAALKARNKPVLASTIRNRWCATGRVNCVRRGNPIMVTRDGLFELITKGPAPEHTYPIVTQTNPKKAPDKYKK